MNHTSLHAGGRAVRIELNQPGSAERTSAKLPSLMVLKVVCLSLLIVAPMTAIAQGQRQGVNCNDPNVICPKPPSGPRPRIRPTPTPKPKQALLGIRWQIQTIDKRGMEVPIAPNASDWSNVEGARILVEVNQTGYLYIVSQTIEKNNDLNQPQVVYSGVVAKDTVVEVPTANQPRAKYNGKYWWKIAGTASRPIVTVFFSRESLKELERGTVQGRDKDLGLDYGVFLGLIQNTAVPKRKILPFVTQAPPIPTGLRNSLTPATQASSSPQGINGSFVTTSSSPSRNDDEVLAEIIEIKRR